MIYLGFKTTGELTGKEYSETVIPDVNAFIYNIDRLNNLLVLSTSVQKFTSAAWRKGAKLGTFVQHNGTGLPSLLM